MLANHGFFLLYLCGLLNVYGFLASAGAAALRHRRLYLSSKLALTVAGALIVSACVMLWVSFFNRDYSLLYVMKVSSNDLPPLYTFTAFWSSLEGSHLLWTMLLSVFAVIAVWTHAKDNEHIMPYVAGTLQAVLAWMFYLLVTHSDPFLANLPAPDNGTGMNELLQNPYMAIHPPLLFSGYTACAIPFAYSMAALCYGDITEGWLKTVRRWALFAFSILTVAIALGGRWAYVELGWAGYWAWDPVENSSFMPWLLTTALLHSLVVQDKLGHLKRLTIVLAVLAFFMSFFGTFITRSGVISSVHAFAESPIGPNYLAYLAVIALVATGLYAFRAPSILPSENDKVWGVSKESALVVTQFLLLSFAAIVFIGTIFPIVSEAITKQRITVQEPYFNAFAPYVGLFLIIGIAIGNLMRYQSGKMPGGKKVIFGATVAAIPLTFFLVWGGEVMLTSKTKALVSQLVGMYFCSWAMCCLIGDFYLKLKDLRFNWKLMFDRNLAYTGAFVAHTGIIIALLGFMGNYRGVYKKVTLEAGGKTELYGYDFVFADTGITIEKVDNATLFGAPIAVTRAGQKVADLVPAQSRYPTKAQSFNEIAVHGSIWHDIYIVLTEFDQKDGKKATLDIHVNPTVRVVWISIAIICIGGLIALCDKHRGNRSRDVVAASWNAL